MIAFWQERRWWIVGVALLLALNTLFFFTYRVRYEERVDDAHVRLEQAKEQLAKATARRADGQSQLEAHRKLVATIATVRDEWWSTPEKRLTKVILEIKSLVSRSGLTLQALSFSNSQVDEKSGTTSAQISFSVQGNYMQVRQLVNLFELSDQFIIIDAISLSGDQPDGTIGLTLRLKTLFKGEPKKAKAAQ